MKISPQVGRNSIKTSVFLKFIIKICFLPITLDENAGTIRFKWISKTTLFHLTMNCGLYVLCLIFGNYLDKDSMKQISELNVIERLSMFSGNIFTVALIFPLILGRQLNNFDMKMVWDEKLTFPQQGLRTIFSFLGLNIGTHVGLMGILLQFGLNLQAIIKIQVFVFLGNYSFFKWN